MPSTFFYRVFLHCRVVCSTKTQETVDGSEIPSNQLACIKTLWINGINYLPTWTSTSEWVNAGFLVAINSMTFTINWSPTQNSTFEVPIHSLRQKGWKGVTVKGQGGGRSLQGLPCKFCLSEKAHVGKSKKKKQAVVFGDTKLGNTTHVFFEKGLPSP